MGEIQKIESVMRGTLLGHLVFSRYFIVLHVQTGLPDYARSFRTTLKVVLTDSPSTALLSDHFLDHFYSTLRNPRHNLRGTLLPAKSDQIHVP